MRRSRRSVWWTAFGAGSAAVVAGLGWITSQVIRLDREETLARAEIAQQETLHLALWRMDSWLAPLLARESARTWFEYQSYYPETLALNRLCEPLEPGEVVVPSPLLAFRSDLFTLHVQFSGTAGFTSPQVPSPEIVANGVVGCVPVVPDGAIEQRLRTFASHNDGTMLLDRVETFESTMTAMGEEGAGSPSWSVPSPAGASDRSMLTNRSSAARADRTVPAPGELKQLSAADSAAAPQRAQQLESKTQARDVWDGRSRKLQEESAAEFKARQSVTNQAQTAYLEGNAAANRAAEVGGALQQQIRGAGERQQGGPSTAVVGPMCPIWLGSPPDRLLLARRVEQGSEQILQGVVVEWPTLQKDLLDRIGDLYPAGEASLQPVLDAEPSGPGLLASLPIRFLPPSFAAATPPVATGIVLGLVIVWIVSLGAIGTTAIAMRSTLRAAQQTSRFASSVTHELRTPLTTFRLYAEMLSDGLIGDPAKSREYLRTLRDESTRLGLLVENVLAWSRLEEGRKAAEPRSMEASELVEDAEPVLQRRCEEAGMHFATRVDDSGTVRADPSRVRQILFNLVDNACKYAGEHARVEVSAARRNGSVVLAVDDDGPGVPAAMRRSVFKAFDRGSLGPGDSVRGLGLGLSISLELARSLGGQLHCSQSTLGGARFELELPAEKEESNGHA